MLHEMNIDIAGITMSVRCSEAFSADDFPSEYESFLGSPATNRDTGASVSIDLKLNDMPATEELTRIFETGESWSLFTKGDEYFMTLAPRAREGPPSWIARFSHASGSATVFCSKMLIRREKGRIRVINPVRYPLDYVLMMHLLSSRQGALLHAAGITINNKGYIFPGRSEAGKSTIAGLFSQRDATGLLSDDRVAVRKVDGNFTVYGTPWPGEKRIARNTCCPLGGIFFIGHGACNKIVDLPAAAAFERLMPVASIPWYEEKTLTDVLSFCENLVNNVPAYEFYFRPDSGTVDFFENFVSREDKAFERN